MSSRLVKPAFVQPLFVVWTVPDVAHGPLAIVALQDCGDDPAPIPLHVHVAFGEPLAAAARFPVKQSCDAFRAARLANELPCALPQVPFSPPVGGTGQDGAKRAEQLSEAPPGVPLHDQLHGPVPLTEEGVEPCTVLQRPAAFT